MLDEPVIITETDDYQSLIEFFVNNGLEFSVDDEVPTDLVKLWKVTDQKDRNLVGGCVLAQREGRFICDGIATDPKIRGLGVGERLLHTMLDEARKLGADSLYLVARAPGFFAKYGFLAIPRENAPTFFECFSCSQYGVSCHPEVMRLTL